MDQVRVGALKGLRFLEGCYDVAIEFGVKMTFGTGVMGETRLGDGVSPQEVCSRRILGILRR